MGIWCSQRYGACCGRATPHGHGYPGRGTGATTPPPYSVVGLCMRGQTSTILFNCEAHGHHVVDKYHAHIHTSRGASLSLSLSLSLSHTHTHCAYTSVMVSVWINFTNQRPTHMLYSSEQQTAPHPTHIHSFTDTFM